MKYRILKERICVEGITHDAYGIEVVEKGSVSFVIHDVFLEKDKAEEFVESCNCLKLSAVHIYDVIEDALAIQ